MQTDSRINITDLLKNSKKLTFLVGSGISLPAPTGLPTGKNFMHALVPLLFPDEMIQGAGGVDKLVDKYHLRFEEILSYYHDNIDPSLAILNVFIAPSAPNILHDFLADNLVAGNPVFTTNFDGFIEKSAIKQKYSNINVAITERDYRALIGNDHALYKLHGSVLNEFLPADTRDTVITTMENIGKVQGQSGLFRIESWKEDAFLAGTKGRTLVVIGYSGNDDFDVMPMLQRASDMGAVVWIQHTHDPPLPFVDEGVVDKLASLSPRVKRYLVPCNTTALVESVTGKKVVTTPPPFDLQSWVSGQHFALFPEWKKYYLTAEMCVGRDDLPTAITCLQKAMALAGCNVAKCANLLGVAMDERYAADASVALSQAQQLLQTEYNDSSTTIDRKRELAKNLEIVSLNLSMCGINTYPFSTIIDEPTRRSIDATIFTMNICIENLKGLGNLGDTTVDIPISRGLASVAHLMTLRGGAKDALALLEESLQLAKNANSLQDQVNVMEHLADASIKAGIPTRYIDEMEKLAKALHDLGRRRDRSNVLFNLAKAYRASNDLATSIIRFKQSLEIACKLPDRIGMLHGTCELVKTLLMKNPNERMGGYLLYLITSTSRGKGCDYLYISLMCLLLKHHETQSRSDLAKECIDELLDYVKDCPSPNFRARLEEKRRKML